jgi:hypothetical protein
MGPAARRVQPQSMKHAPRRPCRRRAAPLAAGSALLALGLAGQPVLADSAWVPEGPTRCAFGAWTNNDFPGPIPVHAAPSASAPILGHLPTTDRANDPVHEYSIGFAVTGTVPGWLRIAQAGDRDLTDLGIKARDVPSGESWIPDTAARFGIQSARGHARPDPRSPRLIDLGTEWMTEMAGIERVLGCDGPWILVEAQMRYRREPGDALTTLPPERAPRFRAWFRGACAIEETTCDMPSVDD